MLTTGSKLYFGLGILSLLGAGAYGWGSRGGLTGVLSLGLEGGIGEHTGYIVLLTIAAVSFFVGGAVIAFRDADAEAVAQLVHLDRAPAAAPAQGNRYWPVLGAVAAGLVVIGLVDNTQLFLLGAIIGVVALLEWMVSAWSDRATGDPGANRRIRNRIMYPLEIPVFGAIGIAALVLCISRVFLAISEHAAVAVASGFAALVIICAAAIAASPKATRTVMTLAVVLLAVGALAGGVIAAASGERKVETPEHQETKYAPPDRNQPVTSPLPQGGASTTTTAAP